MTATVALSASGGYAVSNPTEEAGWTYADMTQRIANRLPWHSKIRKQKHSVGQHLLNAIAGVPLQNIEELLDTALREKFTTVFPLDTPDIVRRATVPEWVDLSEPTTRVNYVPNSSFEIWTNQARGPDSWELSGATTVRSESDFEGRISVRLATGSRGFGRLAQTFDVRMLATTTWVGSVWYRLPSAIGTTYTTTDNFGLRITANYVDGTTLTATGLFAATATNWVRLVVPITLTKEASSVTVELIVRDNLPDLDFSAEYVDVDCVQLEPGSKATPWRPDILDALPYVNNERRVAMFLAGANTAHFVDNMDDFWYTSVPTRSSYVGSTAGTFAATSTAGAVEVTDDFKKTWKFGFEIYEDSRLRKVGVDVPDDAYQPYAIKTRYLGRFDFLQSPVIEALTFFGDYLWAVVSHDTSFGTRARFLHVIQIRTEHPEPSALLSVCVIALPTEVPAVIRAEFKLEDRQHIFLSTATTQYQVRLHYDLFTLDETSRIIYLRENLSSIIPM